MSEKYSAVALGFFDGLHLAHQRVLKAVLDKKSEGLEPTILLFDKQPALVLKGLSIPKLLTEEKRNSILTEKGFRIVEKKFEDIYTMEPEDFFDRILLGELNAKFLSCGFNYTFGARGSGKTEKLQLLCDKKGVELKINSEFKIDGETVSSTTIRKAVADGDILKANKMLGRPFFYEMPVISGDRRGRVLGFPTINQYLPEGFAVPLFGVYASFVYVDGVRYNGVTNIGRRPTFDGESIRSETYILDFSGDLYDMDVKVELLEFIRPEKKFSTVEELVSEVNSNIQLVRDKYNKK